MQEKPELLPSTFIMAPMAGITDYPFRQRLRRNGCGMIFTEMVSAAALFRGNKRTQAMIEQPDAGTSTALQLFGSKPKELLVAAKLASVAGWTRIDFNMGCPVKKVVSTGSGSALMQNLDRAAACIESLREGFRGILSVKIRSGWDADSRNYLKAAKTAELCGADFVTLHPRTRSQGYGGQADWDCVEALAGELGIPLVGNGDVTTGPEAVARLKGHGCAAVMIGRAALGMPWIFSWAEKVLAGKRFNPTAGAIDPVEDLLQQMADIERIKGPKRALYEMRKFIAWAIRNHPGSAKARKGIMAASDPAKMRDRVEQLRPYLTWGLPAPGESGRISPAGE